MASDRPEERPPREIRLEGPVLWLVGGFLAAVLVATFWLGRWFERQVAPTSAETPRDPLSNVVRDEPADSRGLTFFDTLTGGGKVAEPQREARNLAAPPAPNGTAASSPSTAAAPREGEFVVQVFAGRDRHAAEEVVKALGGRGYPVRLEGEREGRGALYRVRVGGYSTRAEAQGVAERLQREGESGAWVTRRD